MRTCGTWDVYNTHTPSLFHLKQYFCGHVHFWPTYHFHRDPINTVAVKKRKEETGWQTRGQKIQSSGLTNIHNPKQREGCCEETGAYRQDSGDHLQGCGDSLSRSKARSRDEVDRGVETVRRWSRQQWGTCPGNSQEQWQTNTDRNTD